MSRFGRRNKNVTNSRWALNVMVILINFISPKPTKLPTSMYRVLKNNTEILQEVIPWPRYICSRTVIFKLVYPIFLIGKALSSDFKYLFILYYFRQFIENIGFFV